MFAFSFISAPGIFAESEDDINAAMEFTNPEEITDPRTRLAVSTTDYPATPGDVYTLVYLHSFTSSMLTLLVDSNFDINLSIFGAMNVRDRTFHEVKTIIEQKVMEAYPETRPQVIIQRVGQFNVFIKGEVGSAGMITCWGLTRLRNVFGSKKTAYSSLRRIEVIDKTGESSFYDLFLAVRFGDLTQDPYVRPGDTIVLHPYERKIAISGEVFRPGTYQLLKSDNFSSVVNYYAGGYTKLALTDRIVLRRWDTGEGVPGETIYLDENSGNFPLRDLDSIQVLSKRIELPVVFFEGAIGLSAGNDEDLLQSENRIEYTFIDGELLSTAIQKIKGRFSDEADLAHAYIVRGEDQLPIDIEKLLYQYDPVNDIPLRPNDHIIIPFKQFFVTVHGAVINPGRFPYIPDRKVEYYIALAGGLNPEKNKGRGITITDMMGGNRNPDEFIRMEDQIYVPANTFGFFLNENASIITALVTAVSLVITLLNMVK